MRLFFDGNNVVNCGNNVVLKCSFWTAEKYATFFNFILRAVMRSGLAFGIEGLPGEVVEGEGEQGEHDDAHWIMVERVVFAEAGDGLLSPLQEISQGTRCDAYFDVRNRDRFAALGNTPTD